MRTIENQLGPGGIERIRAKVRADFAASPLGAWDRAVRQALAETLNAAAEAHGEGAERRARISGLFGGRGGAAKSTWRWTAPRGGGGGPRASELLRLLVEDAAEGGALEADVRIYLWRRLAEQAGLTVVRVDELHGVDELSPQTLEAVEAVGRLAGEVRRATADGSVCDEDRERLLAQVEHAMRELADVKASVVAGGE